MRYPTLSGVDATAYVEARRAAVGGENTDLVAPIIFKGSGTEAAPIVDGAIREFREQFSRLQGRTSKSGARVSGDQELTKDGVEGALCSSFHMNLSDLAAEVLTDPGFWRYLGCVEIFAFVSWRDGEGCKLESFGAGSSFPTWDCVPLRMYVRARICAASSTEDPVAVAAIAGTDVWRSHILRVKTGNAPELAVALAQAWGRKELTTDTVRDVAKRIRRLRSNIMFEVLDAEQATDIVAHQIAQAASTGLNR